MGVTVISVRATTRVISETLDDFTYDDDGSVEKFGIQNEKKTVFVDFVCLICFVVSVVSQTQVPLLCHMYIHWCCHEWCLVGAHLTDIPHHINIS